ncbi:unnamed protein product [Pleuronectes platessa]|uniref:Uncharacterized protein n=1 Tax=Pleuronectes platessa TaxID=8262 RepID=A0A9N7VIM7_PLEPL|nr:unnamed protein product [Pleuronectes platessa]
MPAAGELRCVDAAIESVLEDIDSAFSLKEEHRTRSLHGFVPVTPEAEAPRCAKAASRCFSLRCDRHKVLTWEWMGASCYLRLGAALKCPASRSLHGFVPVTPEAEAPRCAKAASRCFSLRCDRHKVLTWEWMGASCYLRLGAALKRPV